MCDNGVWEFDDKIRQVLKRQMLSLPLPKKLSQKEYRYPENKPEIRGFLDKFFARHFFQIQNVLLQQDNFERLLLAIENRSITVADIGCGTAVASLALLNILSYLCKDLYIPINVNIILNDTVPEVLTVGYKMLKDYIGQLHNIRISMIIRINTPFPKSMIQLRRISDLLGGYDVCCFSYVLLPLKEEATYMQMKNNLTEIFGKLKSTGVGLIIQDRFRESLVRKLGILLDSKTQKLSLRQKIYDSKNSHDEFSYEYFLISVLHNMTYGVNKRFCLQK